MAEETLNGGQAKDLNNGYNKYRASTGQRLLKGLFFEETADKASAVYTLKNWDHLGYPSMYRLFLEADDPTEYTFATAYLDGWDHWEILCACTWFKPYVSKWRRELEVRAKARALLAIKDLAANKTAKESYQANKFLINGGWKEKTSGRGAGRPSKEEVQKEAQRLAQDSKTIDDDFNRITGLN